MGLSPRPRGASRSGGAENLRVAVRARPGRGGRVSGDGGGGGATRGGTRGSCHGGSSGNGAPVAAGRHPRHPGVRADQSAVAAECDEPPVVSDAHEAGWELVPRDPARRRRAPRAAAPVASCGAPDGGGSGGGRGRVGAEYGPPPGRFFPLRDDESEADRAARLGALFGSDGGGLGVRLAAATLDVMVCRALVEPDRREGGTQLVNATGLTVGGGEGVGALAH